MSIVDRLKNRARKLGATIVLPEGDDPRVQSAAILLKAEGIVEPILLTTSEQTAVNAPVGIKFIHTPTNPNKEKLAGKIVDIHQSKGLTIEQGRELAENVLIAGATMMRLGVADGCVAGAAHATSDVLRTGLQFVGMADGMTIASSTFLMILENGRSLTYADCGMVPKPDAEQLATIAVTSAKTHQQLTGEDPIVALLSFSTKGSAKHESVTKVQEATRLAQQMAPDLTIDGELQFDAAFVTAVGHKKAPDSKVPGNANVFIFPNLDAGNIAYKITERIGGAQAIGPLIQGLAAPIHDLSRGCTADDIVLTAAIAAIQAKAR